MFPRESEESLSPKQRRVDAIRKAQSAEQGGVPGSRIVRDTDDERSEIDALMKRRHGGEAQED